MNRLLICLIYQIQAKFCIIIRENNFNLFLQKFFLFIISSFGEKFINFCTVNWIILNADQRTRLCAQKYENNSFSRNVWTK